MRFEECLQDYGAEIPQNTVAGIDIGSRQAKAVLLKGRELYTAIVPTGYFMQQTADELLDILYKESGITKRELEYIVVTGYGRVSLQFEGVPYRSVTEIACHGRGAHYLAEKVRTIIDIGGQDSKAIKIDEADGRVIDFAMNDKCAAGTGRFLEKIANVLGYDVTEMGEASLRADRPEDINSTCVVFAESEVISSRARGASAENLAAGIHLSVANRVYGLLNRVGIESNVLFTGGVSNNAGMKKAFENLLGIKIAESRLDTVFAGALGAAVFAAEYAKAGLPTAVRVTDEENFLLDMSSYEAAIAKARKDYENKNTGKKAYTAFTCTYTPVEVISAADAAYFRLLHRGTADEVTAGETLTQSMQCDFHKSILGAFLKGNKEYKAIERVYSFYSCSCMRKTMEVVDDLFVRTEIFNVPRNRHSLDAKDFLASEILALKKSLEELTGEKIEEETIRERTEQFNLAKKYIREIAEYRKLDVPLITSEQFQRVIHGYYSLPIDVLLLELKKLKAQLRGVKNKGPRKLRLMLSGGIIADGDNKVTQILEKELGATIVVEDNCTGIKPLDVDVDMTSEEDIYHQIAAAYLGKAPCARMYKPQDMLDNSLKLAKEYHVDGVVFYYLKFCPCYSLIEKMYSSLFKENDIPIFIMSGDYSAGDEGQLKTRLEAFTEMLSERIGC